jgi:23S rRNA (cytosine1962-C5)-methyltransferase
MQSHPSIEPVRNHPSPHVYELIDFGRGRKLESFGGFVVNRPCPAASGKVSLPDAWESANLIYESSLDRPGRWQQPTGDNQPPASWVVEFHDSSSESFLDARPLRFIVRPQTSGQLGLFPEHWLQWPWLGNQLERWRKLHSKPVHNTPVHSDQKTSNEPTQPRVLHLFAYTGATTLALATMGAEVTHVDAMRSAVEWARDNCRASGRESLPIRWIVDDARKYVERERKRGKKYDLVLLDPPTYGHGASGEAWSIQRDLEPLLCRCADLISDQGIGLVLTGHSIDIDLQELNCAVRRSSKNLACTEFETARSNLTDRSGRTLDCGYVARFFIDS